MELRRRMSSGRTKVTDLPMTTEWRRRTPQSSVRLTWPADIGTSLVDMGENGTVALAAALALAARDKTEPRERLRPDGSVLTERDRSSGQLGALLASARSIASLASHLAAAIA